MKVLVLLLSSISLTTSLTKRDACFGNLGCIPQQALAGFKLLPQDPAVLKTKFVLHNRKHYFTNGDIAASDESHWDSLLKTKFFDPNLSTKFIIHGYMDKGDSTWVTDLYTELWSKGDFNSFVVDWSHGSSSSYDQTAVNTYIVAAQLTRFLKHLHGKSHMTLKNVHLIGHGFGAQIAGLAGGSVGNIGRISALDPAGYNIVHKADQYRLDKSDADFVDVIHTDGAAFLGSFGTLVAVGDVDFYPNGGSTQPGCNDNSVQILLDNLSGKVSKISCSHRRAIDYYLESLAEGKCHFEAVACRIWSSYEAASCRTCPTGGCPVMGYNADKTPARGKFYLSTAQSSPFCGYTYDMQVATMAVEPKTIGRIYLKLEGSLATTPKFEFTRHVHYYPEKGETEKHVIVLHEDIGTLKFAYVRFEKGPGDKSTKDMKFKEVAAEYLMPSNSRRMKCISIVKDVHNTNGTITLDMIEFERKDGYQVMTCSRYK